MIEAYKKLLHDENILPLSNWHEIKVDHSVPQQKNRKNCPIKKQIYDNCEGVEGIYIHLNSKGECLYIGLSNNLAKRIHAHYWESWNENRRNQHQLPFFKKYKEVLTVKWIECNNPYDRIAIEAMLTRLLEPLYYTFMMIRKDNN